MSRLRRVETISNTKTGHSAKVFRDAEWDEYRVRFYAPDGTLQADQDYHTDCLGEAQSTARAIVWHRPHAITPMAQQAA
jgi:hypothetical protein